MAANQGALARKIAGELRPTFSEFGLEIDSFVVENLSLPDELQKVLDQRIGMTMAGEMGRFTQFAVAQSLPVAAANQGGGAAGVGVGMGAGVAMAQMMMSAMKPPAAAAADTKFCLECGQAVPKHSKFCPECGKPQS
jgi:membrane protease subunit (stomatin/prohibitin family)